jgi:hypothetical protein
MSKSRLNTKLDGIRFIKPSVDSSNKENDKDSPVKKVLAKALALSNTPQKSHSKKRKSSSIKKNTSERSPEAEYCRTQTSFNITESEK